MGWGEGGPYRRKRWRVEEMQTRKPKRGDVGPDDDE